MKCVIASDRLPASTSAREEFLNRYFCELRAEAKLTERGWEIELFRGAEPADYADPRIIEGVEWWGNEYKRIRLDEVESCFHREEVFQISLSDAWTLYAWSLWLAGRPPTSEHITILHIDDHDDLMSPRLSSYERGHIDLITGKPFCLRAPETVEDAIRSGAVGIGSWLTPMIEACERIDIRHLSSSCRRFGIDGCYDIEIVYEQDTLLSPDSLRSSIALSQSSITTRPNGGRKYRATNNISEFLDGIDYGPILLHIDVDYFCNRYNGNSDYLDIPARHDVAEPVFRERVDEVFSQLLRCGVAHKIEDVTVALSPGFFPVEYWPKTIEQIRSWVEKAGLQIPKSMPGKAVPRR